FLVLETGFAEMHLGVDAARQHMQAARIDAGGGGGTFEIADGRNLAGAHAERHLDAPARRQTHAAADHQVEWVGHFPSRTAIPTPPRPPARCGPAGSKRRSSS